MQTKWKWWILGILTLALFGRIISSYVPRIPEKEFSIQEINPIRTIEKVEAKEIPVVEPPKISKPKIRVSEKNVYHVLDSLIACESQAQEKIKTYDPSPKNPNIEPYSFGLLQFKPSTFHAYGEKYDLPHTDIYSRVQQIAIARQMLLNNEAYHWRNCASKIGIL